MRLCAIVGFLLLMGYGCSDPRCPSNLVQVGNSCRCPEGTRKSGPTCVELDGGASPDGALEDDERDEGPADSEDAGSHSPSSDIDANSLTDASVDSTPPDAGDMPTCYVDRDKDGVGAGAPVSCSEDTLVRLRERERAVQRADDCSRYGSVLGLRRQ